MRVAWRAASQCLPDYSCRISRHDFTLPQLFACLVVREQMRLSYRRTEALLQDCRPWCRDIGMKKVPDHATLQRGFAWLGRGGRLGDRNGVGSRSCRETNVDQVPSLPLRPVRGGAGGLVVQPRRPSSLPAADATVVPR